MSDEIPEIDVKPARRTFWQRVSIVWLVPIVGLMVALGVAWQTWSNEGPLLTITFEEASGIKARETELKYRDVVVGQVEKVSFSKDLGHVEVDVRLEKDVAPFVDSDAVFWVVKPEVSARGVSGLETVLSGVFIEGVWDTAPSEFVAEHVALPAEPILKPGESGTVMTLRAESAATLIEGTAITHKGVEVGRVGKPELVPGQTQTQAPPSFMPLMIAISHPRRGFGTHPVSVFPWVPVAQIWISHRLHLLWPGGSLLTLWCPAASRFAERRSLMSMNQKTPRAWPCSRKAREIP